MIIINSNADFHLLYGFSMLSTALEDFQELYYLISITKNLSLSPRSRFFELQGHAQTSMSLTP